MIAPLAEIIRKNNQGLALALSQRLALLVPAQAASFQNAMATISAVQIQKLAGAIPQASLWQVITAQLIPALGAHPAGHLGMAARQLAGHARNPSH